MNLVVTILAGTGLGGAVVSLLWHIAVERRLRRMEREIESLMLQIGGRDG